MKPGKHRRHMVIDLGNTRLKIGIFESDVLLHTEVYPATQNPIEIWEMWISRWQPDRIAMASTAVINPEVRQWMENYGVVEVGSHLNYPFVIEYKTPLTLGQDRLAAVSAANALYKRTNVLIIDCGTCITYDLLLREGRYVGGNIAPGIRMRLRSMHEFTARLPKVDLPDEVQWIGQSTTEALQNGGVSMAIMEARGLIFYLLEKYGSLRAVLTGGDAGVFHRHLPGKNEVVEHLVLIGLNEILKNNEI